jgi:hypothetical protein
VRALAPAESERLRELSGHGITVGLLEVTATGLKKSILDATKSLREFFRETGFHSYEEQEQGTESKVQKLVLLVGSDGDLTPTTMSLMRPRSGNGDPRLWISNLGKICGAGNVIALYERSGSMQIENISSQSAREPEPDSENQTPAELDASILRAILDRATGGSDVASRPSDDDELLPVVHRAPGVDESINWLLEDGDRAKMLFLVGGPGAGKSHAASFAVRGLEPQSLESSELAERVYLYSTGKRNLRLINDATISSDEFPVNPLANEIERALSNGELLIVCVNRGVLVEELAALGVNGVRAEEPVRAILRWIASANDYAESLLSDDEQEGGVIVTSHNAGYLVTGSANLNDQTLADLVTVNLDACSLLEVSPSVSLVEDPATAVKALVPEPYKLARFRDRKKLANCDMPAGELLLESISALGSSASYQAPRNPFAANIASLRSAHIQSGLLNVLRSAEVMTGSNFTFRDMWGVISRVLVGDASQQLGWRDSVSTIDDLWDRTAGPIDTFVSMQKLASYRFSQALFGVGNDFAEDIRSAGDPITRRMSKVDPSRDSIPGILDWDIPASGWTTPLSDAFAGPVVSGSPLETLGDSLSAEDPFHEVVQEFDVELDRAYVDALEDSRVSERQRAGFIAWYGRYLMRLYALSNGVSAFRSEIDEWTLAWTLAPSLPSSLEACLGTLIRPARNKTSQPAIPALASRVEPIVGEHVAPRIARTSGTFNLVTRREGDSLLLSIEEAGRQSPWIPLDFSLVRHAMSCTGGSIGLTEVADVTSPRLERFRSTQLLASGLVQSDYVVLAGTKTYKLQLGG